MPSNRGIGRHRRRPCRHRRHHYAAVRGSFRGSRSLARARVVGMVAPCD